MPNALYLFQLLPQCEFLPNAEGQACTSTHTSRHRQDRSVQECEYRLDFGRDNFSMIYLRLFPVSSTIFPRSKGTLNGALRGRVRSRHRLLHEQRSFKSWLLPILSKPTIPKSSGEKCFDHHFRKNLNEKAVCPNPFSPFKVCSLSGDDDVGHGPWTTKGLMRPEILKMWCLPKWRWGLYDTSSVWFHPQLLQQLEPADEAIEPSLNDVLEKLQKGESLTVSADKPQDKAKRCVINGISYPVDYHNYDTMITKSVGNFS